MDTHIAVIFGLKAMAEHGVRPVAALSIVVGVLVAAVFAGCLEGARR